MRRITRSFISIFILSLIVSCATKLVVDYDYDTTSDFTKPRTYDWIPSPPGNQIEDMTEKRLTHAVNTQYFTRSLNSVASAFPVACCGVSERMPNGTIP